jgi:hypothetical protein
VAILLRDSNKSLADNYCGQLPTISCKGLPRIAQYVDSSRISANHAARTNPASNLPLPAGRVA